MKNKALIIALVLVVLLGGTGFAVYKVLVPGTSKTVVTEEEIVEILPPVDASVIVDVVKSKTAADTVIMSATGLAGKMVSVAYELTYDSQ